MVAFCPESKYIEVVLPTSPTYNSPESTSPALAQSLLGLQTSRCLRISARELVTFAVAPQVPRILSPEKEVRIIRVNFSPRKIVIYHATWADLRCRMRCLVGLHDYGTVKEYKSVGAKEEMCLHCLKEKYTIDLSMAASSGLSHQYK
jgi:hypothetical protein